jgi:hypothetical protein
MHAVEESKQRSTVLVGDVTKDSRYLTTVPDSLINGIKLAQHPVWENLFPLADQELTESHSYQSNLKHRTSMTCRISAKLNVKPQKWQGACTR